MKFLLVALHSSYPHASLSLPCLAARCHDIDGAELLIKEFTVNEDAHCVFESILEEKADVVAFSCYIWNINYVLGLAKSLKSHSPSCFIVLGGPEVSFDAEYVLEESRDIDCIIRGEGEEVFRHLAEVLIRPDGLPGLSSIPGITYRLEDKVTSSPAQQAIMPLDNIPSPFEYGLVDLEKPLVYFETSRGCPFTCAFCLSANDSQVRSFSMERIRSDLLCLIDAEVGTVKFVDRTFNYNASRANEIWQFILTNNAKSRYHFEIAADLLTTENIELLKNVPAETFRFEIGVQSIIEETLSAVGRKSNMEALFYNVEFLIKKTNVGVHLDLVAGLPGEDYGGFLASLERLFQLAPQHIQVEALKILKGAPMMNVADKEHYKWSSAPPYRIVSNPWLAAHEVDRVDTVGRVLELVYNSHRFDKTLEQIAGLMSLSSFFNEIAARWEDEKVVFLSMDQLFEFVWDVGGRILPSGGQSLFREALVFDRCMADYPNPKKLPSYFSIEEEFDCKVSGEEISLIRAKREYSPETKVRGIRWLFRSGLFKDGSGEGKRLLFIYLSTPGKRQEKNIFVEGGTFTAKDSLKLRDF
ncbi:MAG: DUF4080 domain-containing protein [Proteobacteria bacterium]|nr:DUF4080 domain-containing protein [Pseudomonadota bacterium]